MSFFVTESTFRGLKGANSNVRDKLPGYLKLVIIISGLLTTSSLPGSYTPLRRGLTFRIANSLSFILSLLTIFASFFLQTLLNSLRPDVKLPDATVKRIAILLVLTWWGLLLSVLAILVGLIAASVSLDGPGGWVSISASLGVVAVITINGWWLGRTGMFAFEPEAFSPEEVGPKHSVLVGIEDHLAL